MKTIQHMHIKNIPQHLYPPSLLFNHRNIPLRIKYKFFMLPTKLYVIWSLHTSLFFTHYSSKMDFPQTFHYSKLVPILELVYFLVTFALSIPSAWNILSLHLAMASLSSNVTSSEKSSSAVTSVSLIII